ncbi:MAG: 4-hydroxy-tetrahydrodipicolinate synthase [Acidimicrobiales bacterium]|nr:4-hydroxy-tetrahydrodipicolinate synthase [Acidimicrobiales bacterium]
MARFGKVLTAMVTPFDKSGDLDLDVAADLAKWLLDNGNDGLVVAGTTGESPTLTHDEQTELVATVVDTVDAPVIAGAGSNDTKAAIELTKKADKAGASAILSVTPYYNRPPQAGLLDHFRAIADATDLPIILYDIPSRSGRKIETETLLELAHTVENVVALKDAAGDPSETAYFLSQAPEGFEVYSGDDSLTLPLMAIGAVGVVGVATHWTGIEHQKMMSAIESGELEEAQRINAQLQKSFLYESSPEAPNPIPAKVMMELIGFSVGKGRPPMDSLPTNLRNLAEEVLAGTEIGQSIKPD